MNTGMTIVAVLYIATGFYGYLAFAEDIQPSITLSLDTRNPYDKMRFSGLYRSGERERSFTIVRQKLICGE
jgi:amino acid permease